MEQQRMPNELGSDMETKCEVCHCMTPCGWFDDRESNDNSRLHLCMGCAVELGLVDDE